jgi:Fic family protein
MSRYIYQQAGWPKFQWDREAIALFLAEVHNKQGRLFGRMEGLGFSQRDAAVLGTLTSDVIKSSEIEGEVLNAQQVRSSIARRLGLEIAGMVPADRRVDGVVEMALEAAQNYDKPLTKERLFQWHTLLFPRVGRSAQKIAAGVWRDNAKGPMQVVSGGIGRERVHYQAPAAELLPAEMDAFLKWVNKNGDEDPVLKVAIAHLWFVTIHPFEDGNGRIARTIADWALARVESSPRRFYSMSAQIRKERNKYYSILEQTQKGGLNITEWLLWFLGCLERAIEDTENSLAAVFRKDRFWKTYVSYELNERQRMMINKLLDGFVGKLTSTKWAKITNCSQDTAQRDIMDLAGKGIMRKDPGGGRSTSYSLLCPDN